MDIYAKYVGKGSFLFGLPARDITKDEFDGLSDDLKTALAGSGLYEVVQNPQPPKIAAKDSA